MSHPVVVGEFPGAVWGAANDSPVPVRVNLMDTGISSVVAI